MLTTLDALIGGVVAALIAAWATLRTRRPRKSRVELVDVSLLPSDTTKADKDNPPVLDVKVRNIGGQPAVFKRMVVHVHQAVRFGDTTMPTPHDAGPGLVGAPLEASATYDVALPSPEEATDARITTTLSQVVDHGDADRFLVRLARPYIHDMVAYLLHLEMLYDGNDQKVTSCPLAVVFPQRVVIASAAEIGREIRRFQQTVNEVRQAIDREVVARGLPAPDWLTAPPRNRDELPRGLVSVDGNGNIFDSGENGVYIVNENFWNPERAIHRYLDSIEERYRKVVEISSVDVVHELLRDALPRIHATLAQLPALHTDLSAPQKAVATQASGPSNNPDATGELVQLLGGQRVLNELRARANAGNEEIARQLPNAFRLAEKVQRLGPKSPDALDDRNRLIQWWMTFSEDWSGATAAWAELVQDQLPVYGKDHSQTLQARHFLAKCRGEAGDASAAAAAFADLVADRARVLGPDDPHTLDSRHELARWRAMEGNPAAAVEAFTDLVADRQRIQGADHERTFDARYNRAYCRGKAGDAAAAVEEFAELVQDLTRVLGADHPTTLRARHALEFWQDQPDPEDARGQQRSEA
ncbi:hypothetical protein [Actinophytocola sp.]|uniref:hypothetical protein n=1 Tax=Actinophytocola sp. TaxID=1872138 RepID=UPI00389A0D2E